MDALRGARELAVGSDESCGAGMGDREMKRIERRKRKLERLEPAPCEFEMTGFDRDPSVGSRVAILAESGKRPAPQVRGQLPVAHEAPDGRGELDLDQGRNHRVAEPDEHAFDASAARLAHVVRDEDRSVEVRAQYRASRRAAMTAAIAEPRRTRTRARNAAREGSLRAGAFSTAVSSAAGLPRRTMRTRSPRSTRSRISLRRLRSSLVPMSIRVPAVRLPLRLTLGVYTL